MNSTVMSLAAHVATIWDATFSNSTTCVVAGTVSQNGYTEDVSIYLQWIEKRMCLAVYNH